MGVMNDYQYFFGCKSTARAANKQCEWFPGFGKAINSHSS